MKDDPCEKPALWSGLYIGGFVGGGWGDVDITDIFTYEWDPLAKNRIDLSATTAGLRAGKNWQDGNLVLGIEAGLGVMNFSDDVSTDDLEPGGIVPKIGATYSVSGDFYGELTGRVGYAADNALFFVKAGGAFVNVDFDAHYEGENWTFEDNAPGHEYSVFDVSNSKTMFGWTAGVGVEYSLGDSLSLSLEYQHYDFGNLSYSYDQTYDIKTAGVSRLFGDVDADVTLDVVKLGLNYKLQDDAQAFE
ncbi:MAG: outer membrane beta-barrel protein [Hyphomicrobiales bacterium]|nr:outer membrane beta-barrel protein [Hyphomicrobiales bacterium]